MLRVEEVAEHEWRFIYPPKYDELMDKFGEGIELWQMGDTRAAEKIHKEIIAEFPGFLDVYNQLGLLYEESGRDRLAFESWIKGYQIGRGTFPHSFTPGKDLLP